MFKSRSLTLSIVLILCVSISGCTALQRKFVRKKKEKEEGVAIVTTFDYSKELRVEELYKKHFLFWQSWHSELIDKLDATYKKRSACFGYIVSNLTDMKKYLTGSKAEELEKTMMELRSIEPDIKEQRLTKSQKYRIRKLLEKIKRHIDKNFSYPDVKEFVEYAH
ncbi:MAG: hypothetical protein KJ957_06195 [Candidatus Omnitrophica bacterium]|nr:hypothetical protein [Candidatus Omnitrophota bacterium]